MSALVRASGIVAVVVLLAALTSGLLFSARETGARRRPAWWLDLHNALGGISMVLVGVHIVASLADSSNGIGVLQTLVPGFAAPDRLGLSLGVAAAYLFAGAVFTTWPRRLRARPWWRVIHLGSAVGVPFALIHTYRMGTDSSRVVLEAGLVALVAPAMYAAGVRVFDRLARRTGAAG